ncbi:putative signal transduction protein [Escherichia coli]|uniref:Putative signal transduction protein n=1 Tax=Escherichia coli TaxID=562 RepID=A0A377AI70_ECOLX|nr:putative signal transduction protein [Escherichia coli]
MPLTNVKQAQITLQHLQELGCQIAIDDFGTGYASYARLKNVNADLLKIDGSFIRNIVSNSPGLSDCGVDLPSGANEEDAGSGRVR